MGSFYPDRMFAFVYASIYDDLFFPECLVGARIIVVNPDGAMPVIFRYSYWCVIMNEICFSIFVEEEGRIDSANFRKKDRVAPTLLRVFRFYNKIAGVSRGHYNMMLLAGIMEILSATIKEMRVGPSQSVYRNRLQTITSCVLSNQKVVNVVCNKSEDMVRYV